MRHTPTLLIRCDAGPRHGLGHLSRCLNIAIHARKRGMTVQFVCQAPDEFHQLIQNMDFDVIPHEYSTGNDDPANWLHKDTMFVLVDSKEVDAEYIRYLASKSVVICFDDEVARDLPCHAVINYNIWASASDYSVRDMRELWIGPKYNTIDPAYFNLAGEKREGLLITLGGEDPKDHTSWVISIIHKQIAHLPVHICIGPAHPAPDRVIALCHEALPNAIVYSSPSSLVEPISHCALALTAGGTTCYELAASGVAMAVIAIEKHQLTMRDALVDNSAALSLGSYDEFNVENVRKVVRQLLQPEKAERLAQSAKTLFKTSGTTHIIEAIEGLQHYKQNTVLTNNQER